MREVLNSVPSKIAFKYICQKESKSYIKMQKNNAV